MSKIHSKVLKYQERPSARSAELEFYITKLAEAIRFSPKHLHKATYQGQILK